MQITKENLLADREGLVMQRQGIANTINYIDGLLAFLDRPEAASIEAVQLNTESNQEIIPADFVLAEALSENPDLGAVQ